MVYFRPSSGLGGFNSDVYQMIHLESGEMYFGKITKANETMVEAEDIYWLRYGEKSTLVRHSSRNPKVFNRDKILFIEELKDGSPMLKAILNYKQ